MYLKDKLNAEPGFKYIIDSMELMSAAGRRRMLQQPFLTEAAALAEEYNRLSTVTALLGDDNCKRQVAVIRHQLMQLHDLQGSLNSLQLRQVLDEIELFEVKNLAFLCIETAKAAAALAIGDIIAMPDISDVFAMLDPDHTGIPNFYIYDSYHPELAGLRQKLKALQTRLENADGTSADTTAALQSEISELMEQQNSICRQVSAQLSEQLHRRVAALQEAFDRMAYTDFLFAKATLAWEWKLTRPQIAGHDSNGIHEEFCTLWNPRLRHRNESLGQRYQPVDIELDRGVCLVTGANMAGKTVLLKSVGTAQLMAQFGFFVPAAKAVITPVDDVVFCIGDEQNEMNGLSSFASEIIKISDTLKRSRTERLLILIDEPARTTNPVEGKAIVQAVATLLEAQSSTTLITTHYSQLGLPCRRLRVRGFVEQMDDVPLTPENINRFMDYTLLPDDSDEVPQEALRIATILNCDRQLIDTAHNFNFS